MVPAPVLLVVTVVDREDSNSRDIGAMTGLLLQAFVANFSANQERVRAVA